MGLSRGEEAVREVAPTTQRLVFSFYVPEQFQSISYELRDASGSLGPRQIVPAPPKEDSPVSHYSVSTAHLRAGEYEISFWGIGSAGETPIGRSKFRIAAQ
jgi:hypothetical protein